MNNNQRDNEQINGRTDRQHSSARDLDWANTGAGGYVLPIQCDVGVRYLCI